MFWHILGVYLVFLFAHLFLCPSNSEHMSNIPTLPSAVSDPSFPSPSLGLPSATPSPSLGLPSAATPPSSTAPTAVSRVESSGQRSLPPHLGYSQNKDVPSPAALTVRRNLFLYALGTKSLGLLLSLLFVKAMSDTKKKRQNDETKTLVISPP